MFSQPRRWKSRNVGIAVTCIGTIIVPRTMKNRKFRPTKRSRAKPYATMEAESSPPNMDATVMIRVFYEEPGEGQGSPGIDEVVHTAKGEVESD